MDEALLNKARDLAYAKLRALGGEPQALPRALQTVVIVDTAQGIIDNGGLEYFYENDFDGDPPYAVFVDAYRRIGAESAATCIEKTAAMFGFDEPHLHRMKRLELLEAVSDDETHEFRHLSDLICGDQDVWEKLSAYVVANRAAFETAGDQ